MTIRILNPSDWKLIPPGHWLNLNGDHTRIVKVELNCEAETRVDLVHHDAEGVEKRTFIGRVVGLDKIEVVADADASLDFSGGGEVWCWTNDGEANTSVIPDEATFTKLMGRKTRSDQMEIMLRLQQEGYERLLRQQEAERVGLERQLAEQHENSAATDGGTSPEEQPEPAPAAAGQAEGESASATTDAPAVPA